MLSKLLGLWLVTIHLTLAAATQLRLTQNLVKSYKDIPEICQQTSQPCGDLKFIQEAYDQSYYTYGPTNDNEEGSDTLSDEDEMFCKETSKVSSWLSYQHAEGTTYMRILGDIQYVQCQQGLCEEQGCLDGWKHACTARWSNTRLSVLRYYNHSQPEESLCYKGWCVETVRLTFPKHCQCQRTIPDFDVSGEQKTDTQNGGVWGPWSDWETCTKTCGSGIEYSTRICQNGACQGETRKSQNCNIKACTVYLQAGIWISGGSGHGTWGEWDPWNPCLDCHSFQSRTRGCPSGWCYPGDVMDYRDCSLSPSCSDDSGEDIAQWTRWTTCSQTCGGGTQTRERRRCTGFICAGTEIKSKQCNPQRCPDRDTDCGTPPDIVNGQIQGSSFTFGSVVTYICNSGHRLVGNKQRTCGTSGWSGTAPKCKKTNCGTPPDIVNGQIQGSSFTFGSVVTYICNSGYRLVGNKRRTCGTSGWSGTAPKCKNTDCGTPPDIINGQIQGSSLTVGSVLTYICNSGYRLVGNRRRTCGTSGWSGTAPKCKKLLCENPGTPTNGQRQGSDFSFGSSVSFKCNNGYTLNGAATITCEATGAWSDSAPTCELIGLKSCRRPTAPQNGQVTGGSPYNVGATITYSCNAGYNLVGSKTRRCQVSGSQAIWSGQAPTCTPRVQSCGKSQQRSGRVIGGDIADPHAWPWMALVSRRSTSGSIIIQLCGGVLISPNVVLTAGHCTIKKNGPDYALANLLDGWEVVLGEHDLEDTEGTETKHTVTRVVRHPDYDIDILKNDIALLEISPPAKYNNAIQPACLPTKDYTGSGKNGIVTGWGTTDPLGSQFSLLLMQLQVPFIAITACNSPAMYDGRIVDGMFCAGFAAGGKDSCKGDSGGPLVHYDRNIASYVVVGLVSWGEKCALANRPGVYTNVHYYASWIQNNMPMP